MRVGRFQVIGLTGIALFVLGAVFSMILPQVSPTVNGSFGLSWPLWVLGGLLSWIGIIGGVYETLGDMSQRVGPASSGPLPPPR